MHLALEHLYPFTYHVSNGASMKHWCGLNPRPVPGIDLIRTGFQTCLKFQPHIGKQNGRTRI